MDRAAKEAKKRFPDVKREDFEDEDEFFDCLEDRNLRRLMWREGYRQAEKELALTWQDVAILIAFYEQEVELGNISRYEYEGAPSLQEASEIILRKFNEIRKK